MDGTTAAGAGRSSQVATWSDHTPAATRTTRARTRTGSPLSRSVPVTPTTCSPSRSRPVTSMPDSASTPLDAAVRTTARVCRASSIWAS